MSRAYYVDSGLEGCYYVRCLVPMVANGFNGDRTSIRDEIGKAEDRTAGALDAKVVIFHRPDDKRKLALAKLLKDAGKKIVFDNDDTYKIDDAMKFGDIMEQKAGALDEFIKFADLVTCSTEFLANEYRELNKNVVVLKNLVDPLDWPKPKRNDGEKIRIGIVGSAGLNNDFIHIEDTLRKLDKMYNVQLVLLSLPKPDMVNNPKTTKLYEPEYKFWFSFKNIEWHPFVRMYQYFDTLNDLKLDIMIIPRKDNYFNRCKSNLKFLEASMLEIPVIAQGFRDGESPYQKDGDYMKVCIEDDEWMPAIQELIDDKKKRRDMGKRAHAYVLENYNSRTHGNIYKEAYNKIIWQDK